MITLDEQELFRTYAQAKQLRIESLLDQYGSSLADMRELYPKLTETIEKQRLVTTLPTQPLFFIPSEAAEMGLSLEEGWMLKVSPVEGGYKSSFITPSKWEITEDELYISPTGEKYSKADLEALLAPPSGLEAEITGIPTIENLNEEGRRLYEEYQQAGGALGVAGWIDLRERQEVETEEIFGRVFPQQDTDEVLNYMSTNPEGFLADIRELGPTEDVVSLLKSLEFQDEQGNPYHLTDADMQDIFGTAQEYIPESAWKDFKDSLLAGAVGAIQNIETFLLTQPVTKPTRETLEAWATRTTAFDPQFMQNPALYQQYIEPVVQARYEEAVRQTGEAYLRRRQQQQQYWIDHPELAPNPEYLKDPFKNPGLFLTPGYWTYSIGSSLAYSLAVMGTIVAVSAIATPFAGIPAGVLVAAMPEAGAMLDQLISMGVPVAEARQKALLGGLIAGGVEAVSDIPFIGLVFKPLKPAIQPLLNTIKRVTTNAIAKAVITGLTIPQIEGLEEVVTQLAQNAILQHYDATQSLLEGVSQSYIQAVIASLPFGAIGGMASYRTFRSNLSPETGKQLDTLVDKLQAQGLTEEQAQVQAVNELARNTENEAELSKGIEAAKLEYLESQGVSSVEGLIPDQGIAGDILNEIKIAEEVAKKVTPITPGGKVTAEDLIGKSREEIQDKLQQIFGAYEEMERMDAGEIPMTARGEVAWHFMADIEYAAVEQDLSETKELLNRAYKEIARLESRVKKAVTPTAEKVTAKEPWQMTRDEFIQAVREGRDFPQVGVKPTPLSTLRETRDYARLNEQATRYHEAITTTAFAEGKPVPAEVLKDYPDLKATAPAGLDPSKTPADVSDIAGNRHKIIPSKVMVNEGITFGQIDQVLGMGKVSDIYVWQDNRWRYFEGSQKLFRNQLDRLTENAKKKYPDLKPVTTEGTIPTLQEMRASKTYPGAVSGIRLTVWPVKSSTTPGKFALYDSIEGVTFGKTRDTFQEAVEAANKENLRMYGNKPEPVAKPIKGRKLAPAESVSDFEPSTDIVVRRGERTFVVDTKGIRKDLEVQSDVITPEVKANLARLTPEQKIRMAEEIRRTPYLSAEGKTERLTELALPQAPAGMPEQIVIETDVAKIQEIKNSIAEGEMILQSGKSVTGRKMSREELGAVQRSVDKAKARIGEALPQAPPGMPEAGLQAGIPGMAAAEVVRPQPTGKLVQARIDDYLRLREYNKKAVADRIAAIKKLLETKGRLPAGQGTKGDLRLELARLDAQQELGFVKSIEDLDLLIRTVENELGRRSLPGQGEWARSGIALARHPRKPNIFPEYTSRQLDEMRNVYLQAREKMPEAPVIEPSPKAEIPPEIINRVKTDPTPASDETILKKFIDCIKDAKPAREVTEALKHKELQKRSAIFASILQGGEGNKAFEKAKGALRGFLPQGEYILDLRKFEITDAEIERMVDRIRLDDKLPPFQKLNTYEAFTNLVMGAIPTEGELLLLEKEFGSEFVKAIMEKMPTSQKVSRALQDLANVPRTLVTIADLSATLRQGAILAFGQPVQFATAFKEQLRAVFSERNFKLIDEVVHNNVYADSAEQHKLYIAPIGEAVRVEAREEAFRGRLIERIPILGSIIRASERAYITMLNVLRMEVYAYYCRQWEGTGKTSADYDKLASFINHASGRGDLGAFSRGGAWLSGLFFSPRYIMSRVQVPLDLINTTPAVRKVIARNLVAFVGTGMLALFLARLAGAETEDDPRSADFGKIKIGNTRIDFWGGYLPYVRLITQVITEERKSTKTGEVYKIIDPIDVGVNFFRSKLAPVPGFLWDLKSGSTFIGEELTAENAEKIIFEKLTPMFIQDLIEAVKDSGIAGVGYGLLSALGVGIQTYSDNWETTELKLGLPQRGDNFPYTIENEIYDVKDYYSEISDMLQIGTGVGATYEMLSQKKNIPPLVLSVAQARDVVQQINLLPNKRLTSINADSTKGDTFEQYRVQWLARQKITDAEELKQFDKDYPNAEQGNMTQSQYALLVEYHSLPESQKADFLGKHPELYINPREEWLRTHPQENALLALWGKADVFSPEALSKVSTLAHTLDIPENALVMKDLDAVSELKLKNQHLSDLLEAYGGLDDTFKGPDGLTAKDRAIQQLYLDNPDFRDDERRIDALNVGTKDNPTLESMVEGWVERGQIADEFGTSSPEMKLWLIDNKEVHQWALDNGLLSDTGEDWNENILRLQVNYSEDFDKYDAYGEITSPLYISNDGMRADAREAMLFSKDKMTSFGVAYYTINALQKNIPENLVRDYVEYYGIHKKEGVDYTAGWWEDDWFLIEHQDFYKTMVTTGEWQEKSFGKVPTREVYRLYQSYLTKAPRSEDRLNFRIQHPEFDAWLVHTNPSYQYASDAARSISPDKYLALPKGKMGFPIPEERVMTLPEATQEWLDKWAVPNKEARYWVNYPIMVDQPPEGLQVDPYGFYYEGWEVEEEPELKEWLGKWAEARTEKGQFPPPNGMIELSKDVTPSLLAHELAHANYFEELPKILKNIFPYAHFLAQALSKEYREEMSKYPFQVEIAPGEWVSGGTLPVEGYGVAYEFYAKEPEKMPWFLEPFYGNLMYEVPPDAQGSLAWLAYFVRDALGKAYGIIK